jgi:membrane protein implicated in regulation of membrane protease activity
MRPSWAWFVVGGALIVAAALAGIGLFIWALSAFLATDVTIAADGRPHVVEVPTVQP